MKKQKKSTLFESFQNPVENSKSEAKLIPLTHKYLSAYCPVLVQALQWKVAGLN